MSNHALVTLLVAFAIPALGWASEPCKAIFEQPVLLSGDKPDTILVEISGPSCRDAALTVRIVSASGAPLYQRTAPFAQFHSVTGDPPYIEAPSIESANLLAKEIASSQQSRRVADLLPYFAGKHDDGIAVRKFVLPEPAVQRLRQQRIFTLTTGWETWSELTFDPKIGKVVAIAEGWM